MSHNTTANNSSNKNNKHNHNHNHNHHHANNDKCNDTTSVSFFRWMATSLYNLYKIKILSLSGAFFALKSIFKHGANLMVLLEFASHISPKRASFNGQYSYQQCYVLAMMLAKYFNDKLERNQRAEQSKTATKKVALLCSNSVTSALALFALARTGADVTLLNTDMSSRQIKDIITQQAYDLVVCDDVFSNLLAEHALSLKNSLTTVVAIEELNALIEEHLTQDTLNDRDAHSQRHTIPRRSSGRINVLTGGTSGRIKFAKRKPSAFSVLMPLLALLNEVELAKYNSVYIAVPFYHGYGLVSLIISVLLSARIFISDKFITSEAVQRIKDHDIETLILVPTMLSRLLDYEQQYERQHNHNNQHEQHDQHNHDTSTLYLFSSVKRIISGGAKLNAELAQRTLAHTGNTLFNLYGTSEAGFCVMATPTDLQRYPDSIGKAIRGVRLQIEPLVENSMEQADDNIQYNRGKQADVNTEATRAHFKTDKGVGILTVATAWSMDNQPKFNTNQTNSHSSNKKNSTKQSYVSTGDLASINADNYLFLKGRADDMIVSGGENVYPADIENVIKQHTLVREVAVIAVDNEEFGKRLIAFVSCVDNVNNTVEHQRAEGFTSAHLKQWLKRHLARYQMPQEIIVLESLPITKTGKVSHMKLKEHRCAVKSLTS